MKDVKTLFKSLVLSFLILAPIEAMDGHSSGNPEETSVKYIHHQYKLDREQYEGQYNEVGIHHIGKPSFLLWHQDRCITNNDDALHSYSFDICILANPDKPVHEKSRYISVGFLAVTHRDQDAKERPLTLDIDKLEIKQEYRRKGYGESALKILIKEFTSIEPDIQQFWLNTVESNTNAIALYKKLGFQISYTEKSARRKAAFYDVTYSKELTYVLEQRGL